jgi:3-deoxy-manno-octulosonate cytidylyltransferase (CMP-KDO synthetase)
MTRSPAATGPKRGRTGSAAGAIESPLLMRAVIVIPARFGSTRFPGKPLALIAGVSLIQRVYERCSASRRAATLYVATDDARIFDHVLTFGGRVVLPAGDYQSGTDRIAAALADIERLESGVFDQVVNVQGDEPMIDIRSVDAVIDSLQQTSVDIATLACPFSSEDEWMSRDIVKVVTDRRGDALYFSRLPIPHGGFTLARRHIGLYGYQTGVLRAFASLPPGALERAESLEQLRALENGYKIHVLNTDRPHLGVDRPEDVARVEIELGRSHS